jgi:hypothetical protein
MKTLIKLYWEMMCGVWCVILTLVTITLLVVVAKIFIIMFITGCDSTFIECFTLV